jgi:hypothetical protein
LLLRNDGSPGAPTFSSPTTVELNGIPERATPAVGDLDADGRPELVLGGKRGGLVLFQPRAAAQ